MLSITGNRAPTANFMDILFNGLSISAKRELESPGVIPGQKA